MSAVRDFAASPSMPGAETRPKAAAYRLTVPRSGDLAGLGARPDGSDDLAGIKLCISQVGSPAHGQAMRNLFRQSLWARSGHCASNPLRVLPCIIYCKGLGP